MASSTIERGKQKWFKRRPILLDAYFIDLQNGSYIATIYSLVESLLTLTLAIFDLYCLAEAEPGSTHYRYFGISFLFVYSGNKHIRNLLILCAVLSAVVALHLLITSAILMRALRKEYEQKFRPWLLAMLIFTIWRFVAIFFCSIANDLYYSYHQAMLVIWILLIITNVFSWIVVYSNYQELADITKLEDMAKLKMGTMSSLNASHSLSRHSVDSMKNSHSHSFSPHGSSSTASV